MNDTTQQYYIEDKTLHFHILNEGFSYYYYDTLQSNPYIKTVVFSDENLLSAVLYKEHLNKEIQKINYTSFEKIKIIFSNKLFTLVPSIFYKEDLSSDYIEFNSFILPDDPIENHSIDKLSLQVLYSYSEDIEKCIKKNYFGKPVQISHSSYELINKLHTVSLDDINYYIWLNPKSIEIIVFKEKELLFYNFFEIQTDEDIMYYILFVSEQLQINLNECLVHLIGYTEYHPSISKLIDRYIRNTYVGINENLTVKEFLL